MESTNRKRGRPRKDAGLIPNDWQDGGYLQKEDVASLDQQRDELLHLKRNASKSKEDKNESTDSLTESTSNTKFANLVKIVMGLVYSEDFVKVDLHTNNYSISMQIKNNSLNNCKN